MSYSYLKKIAATAVVAISLLTPLTASATPDFLSDLLGKVSGSIDAGNVVKDVIDGVFTKENLSIEDIAGTWQSNGSAVDFRSEDLLKKAGGAAMTSTIETKLNPYFKKYGFDKSVITIDKDGEMTLQVGKYTLSGSMRVNDDKRYAGNFIVKFKALGVMSLGEYDTYVALVNNPLSPQGKELKIMFDAQKLVAMMKCVAALSKSSLAKSAVSMVESYDGICVGFRCSPYVAPTGK